MTDSAKTMFYVALHPSRDSVGRVRRGTPVKLVSTTKGMPSLAPGDIAVAVELDIPWEAFQPHQVGLVVHPKRGIIAAEQVDARELA